MAFQSDHDARYDNALAGNKDALVNLLASKRALQHKDDTGATPSVEVVARWLATLDSMDARRLLQLAENKLSLKDTLT
jgi:hypothetical protein